jgi:hypothetical protein
MGIFTINRHNHKLALASKTLVRILIPPDRIFRILPFVSIGIVFPRWGTPFVFYARIAKTTSQAV